MDPKMDSGYLAQGETLEDDYNVLRSLLPGEVVGIMDQMLCYEVCLKLLPMSGLRTYLILIIGCLDGMAYGQSALSDTFHLTLHRSTIMAGAKITAAGLLPAKWRASL